MYDPICGAKPFPLTLPLVLPLPFPFIPFGWKNDGPAEEEGVGPPFGTDEVEADGELEGSVEFGPVKGIDGEGEEKGGCEEAIAAACILRISILYM